MHPFRKTAIGLALVAAGGIAAAVLNRVDDQRAVATPALGLLCVMLLFFGGIYLLRSLVASIGYLRLRAGVGVVARWSVDSADWQRLHDVERSRTGQPGALWNALAPTVGTVEVIFGRRALLVGHEYHMLRPRAMPALRGVRWVDDDRLQLLDFWFYAPANANAQERVLLRIPVPAQDRAAGRRVLSHYETLLRPFDQEPLAFRKNRLLVRACLAGAALGLVAGTIGATLRTPGDTEDALTLTMAIGFAVTFTSALLAALLALINRLSKR